MQGRKGTRVDLHCDHHIFACRDFVLFGCQDTPVRSECAALPSRVFTMRFQLKQLHGGCLLEVCLDTPTTFSRLRRSEPGSDLCMREA